LPQLTHLVAQLRHPLSKEFFGPLLTVHVYDDADWDKIDEELSAALC
jgi:hypothetical protein